MKKGIKRVLCLVCALLMLVFVMSACGGKDTDSNGSKNGDSSVGSVVVPDYGSVDSQWEDYNAYEHMDPTAKSKPVRFATWIDHETASEGAVPLSTLTAATGLKYEWYKVDQFGYVSKLMTKMSSGDIPDVFVSNETDQAFPLTLQVAAPINKVSSINLEEPFWDQSALATATIDGNVYLVNAKGSPWFGSNLVYYNKTLFSEYGFTTPEQYYAQGNWTWDNFLKCAKDIKTIGTDYTGALVAADYLAGSMGTSFVKYDYKTAKFTNGTQDPKLLEAYQWYADAREAGYIEAYSYGQDSKFIQGKCGLVVLGPYGLKASGYWKDMNPEDVGFTYLPSMEAGGEMKIDAIYRMYGICEGAPNPEGAAYFLRYFLDYKNYDLGNSFLTIEAGNFYYELTNTTADQKYFTFDAPCAYLVGGTSGNEFWGAAKTASSAGVKTAIDSVSNKVDTAVAEANAIIQKKIEADREKYAK